LNLKDIFCKHLPKMPCDYVLSMVSDRQHENIIMTYKTQIIGGVCFRVFKWRLIVEIVFFAVKSAYQSKGYGQRLMCILKGIFVISLE
jgi:N-acetylglutamate synthase-like GNAT family acetyltransferase